MVTLIDERSYQAALLTGTLPGRPHVGVRLNEFMAVVQAVTGQAPTIGPLAQPPGGYAGVHLIVILTRRPAPAFRFSAPEIAAIQPHVSGAAPSCC